MLVDLKTDLKYEGKEETKSKKILRKIVFRREGWHDDL